MKAIKTVRIMDRSFAHRQRLLAKLALPAPAMNRADAAVESDRDSIRHAAAAASAGRPPSD
jgi:hypothetical protein